VTPSFIGLIATMLPGVRPSISLASLPTASTRPLILLIATMDGSLTTMPLPRAYTHVLAVPRSMARSLENRENTDRRLKDALLAAAGAQEARPRRRGVGQRPPPPRRRGAHVEPLPAQVVRLGDPVAHALAHRHRAFAAR